MAGKSYIKLDPASNFRDYGAYSNYGGVLEILFEPTIVIVIESEFSRTKLSIVPLPVIVNLYYPI